MPVSAHQTLGLDQLLEMAWRRRWTALVAFVLPLAALLTAIATLPDIYSASATILVERQQVPEEFVRSTVTTPVESRVQTITQTLLGRSQLTEIIEQFGLYQKLKAKLSIDDIVERMRKDIRIWSGDAKEDAKEKEKARSATEGQPTAFTVTYLSSDPRKASLVANELANRYINEDLKIRERHAEGTAKFLENELEQQIRRKLEEQERKVAQFKEEHMGELPSQETANLSSLERLNAQLLASAEKEVRVREEITSLGRQLADSGVSPESTGPDAITIRLAELRRELAELRKQYTDKYPDVVRVTSEMSRLEKEMASSGGGSGGDRDSSRDGGSDKTVPAATGSLDFGERLRQARAELGPLQAEQRNLKTEIAKYQERVENAPKREQEFTSVRRDYDTLRQVYDSLLKRYEEAKLAQSLEERQKGEQFRVRDYALVPETPTAPNRPRFLLVSLVFSFALAGGAIFLRERLDTSFHNSDEVRTLYGPPVIVTVHRIVTGADRRRGRLRFLGAAAATVIAVGFIVAASYFLTRDNSWLVSLLA